MNAISLVCESTHTKVSLVTCIGQASHHPLPNQGPKAFHRELQDPFYLSIVHCVVPTGTCLRDFRRVCTRILSGLDILF